MANLYVVGTSKDVQVGQLIPVEHEDRIVIVKVLRESTREAYIKHNPETWEQNFERLAGQELSFYETDPFVGEVVLALPHEKEIYSRAHNRYLGDWKITGKATPEDYVQSIKEFGGSLGQNNSVLNAVHNLLDTVNGKVYLYWATPVEVPTQKIRFNKEELEFLDRLLQQWVLTPLSEQQIMPKGQTNIVGKVERALGRFPDARDSAEPANIELHIIEEHELDRVR